MSGATSLRRANGGIDWLKLLQTLGPIVIPLALVGFLYQLGMLETPGQKRIRVESIVNQELRPHEMLIGHPVIIERVAHQNVTLARIEKRLENIERLLLLREGG